MIAAHCARFGEAVGPDGSGRLVMFGAGANIHLRPGSLFYDGILEKNGKFSSSASTSDVSQSPVIVEKVAFRVWVGSENTCLEIMVFFVVLNRDLL